MGSFKDMIKNMTKKKAHNLGEVNKNTNWFLSSERLSDKSNTSDSSRFDGRRDFGIGKEFEHQPSEISSSEQSQVQLSSSTPQSLNPSDYSSYDASSSLSSAEYNNESGEREHKDPLDPFTPRSTERLPEQPNITPPPPLPVKRRENKEEDVQELQTPSISRSEDKKMDKLEDEYGLLPDNNIDKVQNDKLEELLNDVRFLRSQNDLILELLKRIERKLP